jgi:hypothetical protein
LEEVEATIHHQKWITELNGRADLLHEEESHGRVAEIFMAKYGIQTVTATALDTTAYFYFRWVVSVSPLV